ARVQHPAGHGRIQRQATLSCRGEVAVDINQELRVIHRHGIGAGSCRYGCNRNLGDGGRQYHGQTEKQENELETAYALHGLPSREIVTRPGSRSAQLLVTDAEVALRSFRVGYGAAGAANVEHSELAGW